MRWSGFRSLALVVLVAAAQAGCGTNQVTAPTEPVLTTETFTGSLGPGGVTSYSFIAKAGQVTVTLNSLSPADPALRFSMSIAVYSPYYGCGQPLTGSNAMTVNSELLGLATATTSLCVQIGDGNNVIPTGATETFEIKVAHY
jgi:hypothetical protein